ncbi:hypothetical protein BpHYR1_043706 [Brachionus plicatilis]|uniref:Uncharacterized protein n=1 Tax=Brachionus plicatilis TaxID=10195 RepID=A0A3M7T521_BRAPC|nr:hypothetical protein BpHYR1_043706 [Brachionus plicatilis]
MQMFNSRVKNQAKEFNKELKQQDQDVISFEYFLFLDVLRNLRFLRTKNFLNKVKFTISIYSYSQFIIFYTNVSDKSPILLTGKDTDNHN